MCKLSTHLLFTSIDSVIADPRFVDPDEDDFRFLETSAVKRIGFEPFDTSQAGVYGNAEWVQLARSLPMPKMEEPPLAPPLTFRENFESGVLPIGAKVSQDENLGGIEVVEASFARSGTKVLRLKDAPGQKQRYYPMFVISPHHKEGQMRCRFAIRLGPNVVFQHEWRDSAQPYQTGPSLWFEAGKLRTPHAVLMEIPADEWILIDVMALLGDKAGKWSVKVTIAGEDAREFADLPVVSSNWQSLDWLGFVSQATVDAEVCIDDLELAR